MKELDPRGWDRPLSGCLANALVVHQLKPLESTTLRPGTKITAIRDRADAHGMAEFIADGERWTCPQDRLAAAIDDDGFQ